MRFARIVCLCARAPRLAMLGIATALVATTVPAAAATDVQGTITVAGEGSGQLFGCGPCTPSLTVATAGYVVGLDGTTPFTLSWGTPGVAPMPASMTLSIVDDCASQIPGPPTIESLGGSISISGAVLVYNGVQTNATVTGQFSTQPISGAILVVGLSLTAQSGTLSVSITVASAKGLLNLTPLSDSLCPNPTEPTPFALSGTLLTAA